MDKVFAPGETQTIDIPLSPMYKISDEGTYHVKAIVKHGQLSQSYQTNVADFKIVTGTLVWETTVGVPSTEDNQNSQILHRKYLLYSFFDGRNKVYCLRIDDDKYVYGLARLGVDIGVTKPECMVDRISRLHILLQSSPLVFSYYVYDTNCSLEEKDFFRKTENSVPKLFLNKDVGRIEVIGGARASEGKDYVIEKNSN